VVVSFSLVLSFHPRLLFPDFAIKGTLTGSVTIWTGNIKIESDVIVEGTNTLIIDGAVIQNSASHDIIVRDSGNLTIINGARPASALDVVDDEFRVTCEDNSVVRVSNSMVGWMFVYNTGGSVMIEAGSVIGRLGTFAEARVRGIKPTIRDSTIVELHTNVLITGNFSLRGDDNASTVEWTRYHVSITDSPHGVIDTPTIKLEKIWIHNSSITLTHVNYTTLPTEYLRTRLRATQISLFVFDSNIRIEESNLGWYGQLILEGTSSANVTRSVIGLIDAYEESQFVADHANAVKCRFYESSHATIRDSIDSGWAWQTHTSDEVFDMRWKGVFDNVEAHDQATIILDNVIVNQDYYTYETIVAFG
jgi:hypothetical protein